MHIKKRVATLQNWVWRDDAATGPLVLVKQGIQLVWCCVRALHGGDLSLRAMSLVYTTILAIVPVLALSFSLLKAFGVHNQLEPFLLELLAPIGEKSTEITARVLEFVNRMQVGVLGILGVATLLYVAVSMIQKIEDAFNTVWRVSRGRSLGQRFSQYLSVLMLAPLLVVVSSSLSSDLWHHPYAQAVLGHSFIHAVVTYVQGIIPFMLLILAFLCLYMLLPHTRVRVLPAFSGAVVAAVLWEMLGGLFTLFMVQSGNYEAVYSGFAIVLLLLVWIYVAWMVVLIGAQVAFFVQYPYQMQRYRSAVRAYSQAQLELLALRICEQVASHFEQGQKPPTTEKLIHRLRAPLENLQQVLENLRQAEVLRKTNMGWLPSRPLHKIELKEVLNACRGVSENSSNPTKEKTSLYGFWAQQQHAAEKALDKKTLADLLPKS